MNPKGKTLGAAGLGFNKTTINKRGSLLDKKNSTNLITKCLCKCKCIKCSAKSAINPLAEKIPNFSNEINDFKNEGMKNLFENIKIFENFPIKNLLEFIFVFCEMSLTR